MRWWLAASSIVSTEQTASSQQCCNRARVWGGGVESELFKDGKETEETREEVHARNAMARLLAGASEEMREVGADDRDRVAATDYKQSGKRGRREGEEGRECSQREVHGRREREAVGGSARAALRIPGIPLSS